MKGELQKDDGGHSGCMPAGSKGLPEDALRRLRRGELELESVAEKSLENARALRSGSGLVGGGFAGQVYRVKALSVKPESRGGVRRQRVRDEDLHPPREQSPVPQFLRRRIPEPFPDTVELRRARGAPCVEAIRRGAHRLFRRANGVNDVHGVFVDTNSRVRRAERLGGRPRVESGGERSRRSLARWRKAYPGRKACGLAGVPRQARSCGTS